MVTQSCWWRTKRTGDHRQCRRSWYWAATSLGRTLLTSTRRYKLTRGQINCLFTARQPPMKIVSPYLLTESHVLASVNNSVFRHGDDKAPRWRCSVWWSWSSTWTDCTPSVFVYSSYSRFQLHCQPFAEQVLEWRVVKCGLNLDISWLPSRLEDQFLGTSCHRIRLVARE